MKNNILFFVLCLCLGCNRAPESYQRVIDKAHGNREELLKVVAHYDSLRQPERRDAAYYLIGTMEEKYFWAGDIVTDFDSIFRYMDSLHRHKIRITVTSPLLKSKWDKLVWLYGTPSQRIAEKHHDYEHYTAHQIIGHIDQAFEIRDSIPWAKNMSKKDFYEYILPHRIGTERPEDWNQMIYHEYQLFRDTTTATDRLAVAEQIHRYVAHHRRSTHTFDRYPFDIPYSFMSMGKRAVCRHLVNNMTMVMRANGLPVSIDYIPLWGSRNGGHFWCVLWLEDGTPFPFDVDAGWQFGDYIRPHYMVAKVYRKMFRLQDNLPNDLHRDVPPSLLHDDRIDVTHEYTTTHDIAVDITYPDEEKKRVVICTFDNKAWKAQDWGNVKHGKAYFEKMGADVMYMAMYYKNGELQPASDPFLLKKTGEIQYILPSGYQEMRLLRKFPRFPRIEEFAATLLEAKIQGANRADFSDAVDLHKITETSDKIEEIEVDITEGFRYVRFLSDETRVLSLAELMFYDDSASPAPLQGRIIGHPDVPEALGTPFANAFDGDLETYFRPPGKSAENWAGLDLGTRKKINRVRYAPRSDTNFILVGDSYELYIWDKDKWKSLGKQVAIDQHLLYKQVPANGLYLLRNHTRGREERIFTYENGEQAWW